MITQAGQRAEMRQTDDFRRLYVTQNVVLQRLNLMRILKQLDEN